MKRFIHLLSSVVRRWPVFVLIGALALTMVFGAFTRYQQTASGNEGFSPDSAEFLASQTIEEQFQENSTTFVQIVVSSRSGDVLTAGAVAVYLDVVDAVWASRASELLASPDDVVGYLDPVIVELEARGIDPRAATDADVKDAYLGLYPEVADDYSGLYSSR
ncbi:MAG: hypothetical protein KJ956_12215, partial [Actinobacteria bacterium]|nr:hypothetical protein [Actinomycetota bacterium]